MRSIAYSALCLLSFAVGASPVAIAQGPSSGQIPPGSRVVIAPMGGFETYFAAAVREKEVPIILTLDKDSAQYFLVSTETEWEGFVYGSAGGNAAGGAGASSTRGLEASIMLIDAKTKDVMWAYEVHKSNFGSVLLGTLAARGKQSLAEACAKHLKEFIERSAVNGGSSSILTITPMTREEIEANKTQSNSPIPQPPNPSSQPQPSYEPSTVAISSTPPGADIFVDQDFLGNTPSTINISSGKHVITVKKPGFQEWVRSMNFHGGSINLKAELIRGADETPTPSARAMTAVRNESPVTAAVPASAAQTSPGWIGVSAQNAKDGALVTDVTADGPGAAAGIKVGDIIQALDGRLIKDKNFEDAIASLKPGTKIVVNYVRGALTREALVTVGKRAM